MSLCLIWRLNSRAFSVIRDTVLAANPTVDLFKADAEGITACHLACTQPWLLGFAHLFSSEELLARTLHAKTVRDTTPLATSVLHNQDSFALRLLEKGVSTPVFHTCHRTFTTIPFLKDAGVVAGQPK